MFMVSTMKMGDRVQIVSQWSGNKGLCGELVDIIPRFNTAVIERDGKKIFADVRDIMVVGRRYNGKI